MVLLSPYSAHPTYLQVLSFLPLKYVYLLTSLHWHYFHPIQHRHCPELPTALKWVPSVYTISFNPHHSSHSKTGYLKQILILLKHVEGLHISIHIQPKLVPKIYKAVQIQTSDGLPTDLIHNPVFTMLQPP